MSRQRPFMKFYPSDWRSDPQLRMCGLPARGLWMEMLTLMHEAQPYGHLLISGNAPTDAQLGVLVGAPPAQIPDLLRELETAGVFSRTRAGVIYSRRMTRDEKRAQTAKKNGEKGGNPTLRKTKRTPNRVNHLEKPHISEARVQMPDKTKCPPPSPQGDRERDRDLFCQAEEQPPSRRATRGWRTTSSTEFEDWYAVYPRKVGRGQAEKAYCKARYGVSAETLLAGAKAYAALCRAKETDPQYIAHPATWLNGQRWTDEDLQDIAVDPDPVDRRAFQRAVREWEDNGSRGPAPATKDFLRSNADAATTEDSHDTLH